jgi:GDP-L-fucose synthase
METNDKIAVLGGTGMLGSSIIRTLEKQNYKNIILKSKSSGLDLLDYNSVNKFFEKEQPKYVFMVAGLVGGIIGNQKRNADFLYENATMILNVLNAIAKKSPQTKILFTGSTCIYPKKNPQPIKEERLLAGRLEETNKGYALAKITGVVGCELYRKQYGLKTIAVMPTNMYGKNDNYNLETGHMIPSLIKKFVEAKKNNSEITLWGTGNPRREALYVDDCADACIYLMKNYEGEDIINIGTGFDYSIKEFAEIISNTLKYKTKINWDKTKPDGTKEKKTDITKLKKIMPDFKPRSFEEGLKEILKYEFNIDLN